MDANYVTPRGQLGDKVAIVTGGGRGIGRAIALRFAQEGARVTVAARTATQVAAVAAEIGSLGGQALAVAMDVSQRAGVQRMLDATVERFGRLDILVNNAAIATQSPFVALREEDWDQVLDTNAKGVYLCAQAAVRQMIRQGSGGRINIFSYSGKVGQPYNAAYCASKFAVIGLSESLARELAPYRINVNAICPGRIETEMMAGAYRDFAANLCQSVEEAKHKLIAEIPYARMGQPEEVADLALFLASDASSYVTAQAIQIHGGMVPS